jgi:broad specificity phosphatase PhoE
MSEVAEVWLVRHARTEANASGIWQGRTESDLDAVGEGQIAALAARLDGEHFDLVLSSPLQRARKTAAIFGDPIIEQDLVEIDLGRWDGLTTSELMDSHRPDLEAFTRGEDVPLGGTGESPQQITMRIESIIARVFDRLQPGERAVVVTHGGVLDAVTQRSFGRDASGRRLGGLTENTGITRLIRRFGSNRLVSFNDTGHLGARPAALAEALARNRAGMVMVRHGQTRANVERRWQGQSDWGLDDVGRRQVQALASWYGHPDRVVSSPLGRALETARVLGPEPEVLEGLVELGFGEWEGLTVEEVRSSHSALFDRIFVDGQDLPRGVTGESWAQLTARFRAAIDSINPGRGLLTAVVTHGAAIRSYLADLAGSGWSAAGSWETPANSSVTHLVLGERGPLIVDYSSAIHLESLQLESPQSQSAKLESSKLESAGDARHEHGKEQG